MGNLKCSVGVFFILLNLEVCAQHTYDADQVIEKRFTYNTLSPYPKSIFNRISRGDEDPSIDITEEIIDKTRLIKLTFDIPASFDAKNPLLVLTPIVQTK